jgi:hypothetical protein
MRLKDAVSRTADERYRVTDPTFALWLRSKRRGEGTVVPMSLVGDEAHQAVAHALAAMGFDLSISPASPGVFSLLPSGEACRRAFRSSGRRCRCASARPSGRRAGGGLQARTALVVAAVDRDGSITALDPHNAARAREVRLRARAVIENVLLWRDRRSG